MNALAALGGHLAPRARVVRGGERREVPAAELVVGDTLLLSEGTRVAADVVVTRDDGLNVDMASFTGEGLPEGAGVGAPLLAGMVVLAGEGRATVVAIGARTELARLGRHLEALRPVGPRSAQVQRTVRVLGAAAGVVCVATVAVHGWARGDWSGGILAGVALAVAVLPEELPVVRTLLLALSARRIARRGLVVRQLDAVETLGAVEVLCIDKTGTLTANQMCVVERWTPEGTDDAHATLVATALSATEPVSDDPTDRAVNALREANEAAMSSHPKTRSAEPAGHWPHAPERPVHVHAWACTDGTAYACKGAPEAVIARCALPPEAADDARRVSAALASDGMRVMAVASLETTEVVARDPPLGGWRLRGVLALADPLRSTTPAAVAALAGLGVRVVVLTGDHPGTARAISTRAGLDVHGVRVGTDLETLDDAALDEALAGASICARVTPVMKLRLVQGLQRAGAVVAMTGDGVNDAPALRAADVGLAMGSGADLAREAASIVLQEADLLALADGIVEGRRVAEALRASLEWLLAVHLPIAGVALAAPLGDGPLLLLPMHVAMLELCTDPIASGVFAAVEAPPRGAQPPWKPDPNPRTAPLLPRAALLRACAVGAVGWVAAWLVGRTGASPAEARTATLVVLVGHAMAALIATTARRGSVGGLPPPTWAALGVILLAALLLFLSPALRDILSLAPLGADVVLRIAGASALLALTTQAWARERRRSA